MCDVTEAKESGSKIAEAHRELSVLDAIASLPSKSLDLDTVLGSALDETLEIMRGNIGGILLPDEQRQMLCYRVHRIAILSPCHRYTVVSARPRASFAICGIDIVISRG